MGKRGNKPFIIALFFLSGFTTVSATGYLNFFPPDNTFIQYTGRIDFTDPRLPRFWQPGVCITIKFSGPVCEVILQDEMLWGKNHNYLELVIDGSESRIRTRAARDTIIIRPDKAKTLHTLTICKNTEANIGYLELVGFRCEKLVKPDPLPERKIEWIGNSITCGTGSDTTDIPCGTGMWQDQHNAWMSYGAVASRHLQAQFHLSAVSGIGLMHSCCSMNILMPEVFDKISMRDDSIEWDFKRYRPELVAVCLGQNDGLQDSAEFCSRYISFLKQLREYYPDAALLLLSSPMADDQLRSFMRNTIISVKEIMNEQGDARVYSHIFNKQYSGGCDSHPSLYEHQLIAAELGQLIGGIMNW